MELAPSTDTHVVMNSPNESDFAEQQVDILCCPASPPQTRSSVSSDSEDEKESLSSSFSDSSSEGSGISATDSSDPSSPVTCIPWVGRIPPLIERKEESVLSSSSKGETINEVGISTSVDRKRKERHESSLSQEQDIKVIRSIEPDVGDNERKMKEQENDSRISVVDKEIQSDYVNTGVLVPGCEDDKNFGRPSLPVSLTEVDYGISSMPICIEPEIQRQWERTAAQWQSRKLRRSHRPRRYGRSSKSFSEAEDVIRSNYCNIEELRISNSSASMSISRSSQDEGLEEEGDYVEILPNSRMNQENPVRRATMSSVDFAPLPQLDLTTLHHQVESEEPISFTRFSSEQVMLSPRNSVTVTEGIDVIPPSPPNRQLPMDPPLSRQILDGNQDAEIQLLSRQISNWKKQLKALEGEYAQVFGYKPSHADKLKHREMRKCVMNISRAKQELKQIREDPSAIHGGRTEVISLSPNSRKNLETMVAEIEIHLAEDRNGHGRPEDPILMNPSELILEKGVMQRQLLMLEKLYGRPTTKDEKDVVRKLYDRYRIIKKLTVRFTVVKENTLDLVPILEHEALDLRAENIGEGSRANVVIETKKSPRTHRRRVGGRSSLPSAGGDVPGEVEPTIRNEDFNDMNLNELERHYKITSEEKRRLRSALRAIESDSQAGSSGWHQQKQRGDEKYSTVEGELMHQKYKHTRATLRLLEVLINKRKYPKLLKDVEKIEY